MRRIAVLGAVVFGLVACSGDNSSVTEFENPPHEVVSIYDLGKCSDSRRGEVIFVAEEEEEYLCYSGKWIPESEWGSSRKSSSEENASSEKGKSSSSEKSESTEDASSSSAKPSSSATSSSVDGSSSSAVSSSGKGSSSSTTSSSGKGSSSSATSSSVKGSSSSTTSSSVKNSSSSAGSSAASSSSAVSSSSVASSSSVKSSSSKPPVDESFFVDTRDGKSYRTVKIGSQRWFAENLNYWGDDVTGYCHSGKPENCSKYGVIYDWDDAKKACPTGTHLPTIEELQELIDFVGEDSSAVVLMADTGWTRDDGFLGTDKYGFAMLPGSYKAGRSYGSSLGWCTNMWTASDSAGLVYAAYLGWNLPNVSIALYDLADGWGMYVRCLEGNAKPSSSSSVVSSSSTPASKSSWQFLNPALSYGQMTDSRDGQVYKTIVVDTLTWMAENLNYETDDSFCYNDSAKYCATYGRLYKWSVAMNACPEGWHLATYDDAYTLTGPNLQCYTKSADELRSMEGWIPVNGDDTRGLDAYGFSASPGGRREASGQYVALGTEAGYWFMIEAADNTIYDWVMEIHQDSRDSKLNREYEARAHSVRCVKNAK